eukprot:4273843-Amphidinium_carterae.2
MILPRRRVPVKIEAHRQHRGYWHIGSHSNLVRPPALSTWSSQVGSLCHDEAMVQRLWDATVDEVSEGLLTGPWSKQ